jgi:hypothetical protein
VIYRYETSRNLNVACLTQWRTYCDRKARNKRSTNNLIF